MNSQEVYNILSTVERYSDESWNFGKVHEDRSSSINSKDLEYLVVNNLIDSMPADKYLKITKHEEEYFMTIQRRKDINKEIETLDMTIDSLKKKLPLKIFRYFKDSSVLEKQEKELEDLKSLYKTKIDEYNNLKSVIDSTKHGKLVGNTPYNPDTAPYFYKELRHNAIRVGKLYFGLTDMAKTMLPVLVDFVQKDGSKPYESFVEEFSKLQSAKKKNEKDLYYHENRSHRSNDDFFYTSGSSSAVSFGF